MKRKPRCPRCESFRVRRDFNAQPIGQGCVWFQCNVCGLDWLSLGWEPQVTNQNAQPEDDRQQEGRVAAEDVTDDATDGGISARVSDDGQVVAQDQGRDQQQEPQRQPLGL